MLKYVDTKVVFSEVPDEITLAINISKCPCHCEGCHSSYLAEDIGDKLNWETIKALIKDNEGITCIAFMGGDASPITVNAYASIIKNQYPELKVVWYSGRQELSKEIDLNYFDFIKLGPYIQEKGPLSCKTTNQKFYEVNRLSKMPDKFNLKDITNKFWK